MDNREEQFMQLLGGDAVDAFIELDKRKEIFCLIAEVKLLKGIIDILILENQLKLPQKSVDFALRTARQYVQNKFPKAKITFGEPKSENGQNEEIQKDSKKA
jgi:hypothetical protein